MVLTALVRAAAVAVMLVSSWAGSLAGSNAPTQVPAPSATTATATFPTDTVPASNTAAAATTTQTQPKKPIVKAAAQSIASAPAPAPAASTPAPSKAAAADYNAPTRAALVNILCTTKAGGAFAPISGSGVVVDSRGIILTNAHVAQFLLLRDYGSPGNIDCVVRTGSPATPQYRAEIMYLPPAWVAANASQLTAGQATGTGENDYAFLRITGTTNPARALPAEFPYLSMSTASADLGDYMLLAAYPAGFLSGELIQTNLYASSAYAYAVQLFTFASSTVDLFSVAGSIASQPGSSGGAAVRTTNGTLAGIISTATVAAETDKRDLRAISVGYIDRALVADGKGGITGLLSQDAAAAAADFNANVAPTERAKLYAVLDATR